MPDEGVTAEEDILVQEINEEVDNTVAEESQVSGMSSKNDLPNSEKGETEKDRKIYNTEAKESQVSKQSINDDPSNTEYDKIEKEKVTEMQTEAEKSTEEVPSNSEKEENQME